MRSLFNKIKNFFIELKLFNDMIKDLKNDIYKKQM